jgi:glycosyltransferase involved in cell wall biosynthesis
MNKSRNGVSCLNPQYSTTRMVTEERPRIENSPSSKVQMELFLPTHPKRQGEGGLRTKGYFKKSFSDRPLISIITVVFNGQAYLEQAVQSVLNQSYDNVEYIIIDGGSTDGTIDVIRKYEHLIDYWISEPDEGIYDAMNKGIMLSTGRFIYFLGADDILFNVLDKISSNLTDDFKICYGSVLRRKDNVVYKGRFNLYKIFKDNICQQAIFYPRNVFTFKGIFNIRYAAKADHEMNLRCWADKKIKFEYCSMVIASFGSKGLSSQTRDEIFAKDKTLIIKSNFGMKYYLMYAIGRRIVKLFIKID